MDSTGDTYSGERRALVPMMLVGFLVGTSVSEDSLWGLYGMGLGFVVWLAWVLALVLGRAWAKTREARR